MTPRRRRTGLLAGLAGGAVLLALGGGGLGYAMAGRDSPAASVAAASANAGTPAPSATAAATSAKPTGARDACEQFAAFSRGIPDDNYGQADLPPLKAIGQQASASDSLSIAARGMLLADAIDIAVDARGRSDEAKYLASVKQSARDLRKSCAVAGFPT